MVEIQTTEYLAQLLKDKKQLAAFPNVFLHLERILDEEISRIRVNLFQLGGKESVCLPEPIGTPSQQTEKLYVPVKDHPEFNFVGRILGPRGMTAKQLEQETGCKIMVRGKGSMRDKAKEDQMKGKPNWEHLNDELHVLITVEDTKNRAEIKLKRAVEEIKRLLVPAPEGEDELKKKQLMELAIINGTYRDGSKLQQKMNQILMPGGMPPGAQLTTVGQLAAALVNANNNGAVMTANVPISNGTDLRSPPNQLGQPLIISPRLNANNGINLANLAQNNAGLAAVQFLNGHQQQQQQQHQQHHHQQQQQQVAQQQQQQQQQILQQASQDPTTGLIYTIPSNYLDHHAFAAAAAASQALLEYPNGLEFSQAGSIKPPQRFQTVAGGASGTPTSASMRAHPYARVALS